MYGLDLAVVQQAFQLLRIEIGYADALREAQLDKFLHGTPGVQVVHVTERERERYGIYRVYY